MWFIISRSLCIFLSVLLCFCLSYQLKNENGPKMKTTPNLRTTPKKKDNHRNEDNPKNIDKDMKLTIFMLNMMKKGIYSILC